MPEFIPGLDLSEAFYHQAVQPLLRENYSNLPYSAARLDWGSDVLGFDTPLSMDHGWGPKVTVFLTPQDHAQLHQELHDFLANNLPLSIHGFPTHFGEPYADGGRMEVKNSHPIHHMVTITTLDAFFQEYLSLNSSQAVTSLDWLSFPQQKLRTLRSGRVFHDGLGQLVPLRQTLYGYPHDLWLYLMACQWQRIDQDEPFIGRTGSVGDELGSRLLGSRLIREMMRLAFLMAQEYAPYTKWFGTAFQQLALAPQLISHFNHILESRDWKTREAHLSKGYMIMAEAHNALGVTPHIPPEISNFHNRPFMVPHSARFVAALFAQITDPQIKRLTPHVGSIDQISDNTDVLENPRACRQIIEAVYSQNRY
jgi:hypothetical protein